ncbi:hypothetical protein G4X40_11030 [Rhodococcus sp. D2-41]|uniref:Uncharacterized protein n=1 Tax=Speluncibacter jeojiensis TaxID=2710754 RepID=A0A9X4M4W8_9ACTN|nr:hypothetical protein [Rhodococcus sp. D2-41]MDG3010682.1 hypothetical protein [Rhodococcus sp. D2-41]MDG3016862.1 hypothetical protein [Corynebacteriales bacterium D3-21]
MTTADDVRAIQQRVALCRARIYGGYGPGADEATFDRWTRDRSVFAGQPVVERLSEFARRTAAEKAGGTPAVAEDAAAARDSVRSRT